MNFFGHTHILPKYFWGNQYGEEMPQEIQKMNCISTVLRRVDRTGYSHHIERLMVLGNFMLLCGIHPHEVNTWFFERYIDAFEWVVSPNVIAMSQFAD